MPSSESYGERVAPNAKGIATVITLAIWSPRRVGLKRSRCPEIAKASSTRRHLNATVAMNPTLRDRLMQKLVAGTNTHKVGDVAQTLMGVAPSASTISRLNQTLTQQFEQWRQRRLQAHWRIIYLD
jgi:hypothetical protein